MIRWINQFITINVFDWLSGWGLSMGIVLLILTIMVKVVVYPATWKTYMSSAKMRVLKPKIDEINKKYPKQEDAMKKQQEVMGLVQPVRCKPDGRLSADVIAVPYPDGIVHVRTERYRAYVSRASCGRTTCPTYDAFITFPFHIPFLGNHLSLFCLLMTVTNILNTKYTMTIAGYRSTTANGCDEMDDVSDADYVPVRT